MVSTDYLRRFLFEDASVRGQLVKLDEVTRSATEFHQYPRVIRELVNQAIASAALMATSLKFEGRLSLQLQYGQHVNLLYAECNHLLEVKATARWQGEPDDIDFKTLVSGGQMVVTIEPDKGERYQGVIALQAGSLAACLEHYFEQSEQLCTRLWIACDAHRATGLMIQRMPSSEDPEFWNHLCVITETVTDEELLELPDESLFTRLYHNETLRLFDAEVVTHKCSCSKEKCERSLLSLSSGEVEEWAKENDGELSMTCEFCNKTYTFDELDIRRLLVSQVPSRGQSDSQH